MIAWTSSPFLSTSEGCLMRFVQDMSETCTRPSTPSSISTNAPKSVRLRTLPETESPTLYLARTPSQGSGSVSLSEREFGCESRFTSETIASTVSPGETTLAGFLTFLDQDISKVVSPGDTVEAIVS